MAVSALAWRPGSGTVAVGTLHGCVELHDVFLKRTSCGRTLEVTCWKGSRATIRHAETGQDSAQLRQSTLWLAVHHAECCMQSHASPAGPGQAMVVACAHGALEDVDIYHERYVVGRTPGSLLLADARARLSSEIPWTHSRSERFSFGCPQVPIRLHATPESTSSHAGSSP